MQKTLNFPPISRPRNPQKLIDELNSNYATNRAFCSPGMTLFERLDFSFNFRDRELPSILKRRSGKLTVIVCVMAVRHVEWLPLPPTCEAWPGKS